MFLSEDNRKRIEQREIGASELFFYFLSKRKSIMITLLVFVILFNGIYFINNIKTDKNNPSEKVTEESLSKEEQENVDNMRLMKRQLRSLIKYKNNSELMKINAYRQFKVTLQYSIESLEDDSETISEAYQTYINGGALVNETAPKLDYEQEVLGELITVYGSEKERTNNSETTFKVEVVHRSKSKCKQIAGMVDASIRKQKFSSLIHNYKLIRLSKSSKMDIDMELQKHQDDIINFIAAKQTGIKTLETNLSSDAKFVLGQEENKKNEDQNKINQVFNLKYTFVGICSAILLLFIVYFVRYTHDFSLKHEYELRDIFGLKLFGILDEQTISEITMFCKKAGIVKLYIMTNVTGVYIGKLVDTLEKEGIIAEAGESILTEKVNLKKALEFENVLLIEKVGISDYRNIALEIEKCENLNINILGSAVLK